MADEGKKKKGEKKAKKAKKEKKEKKPKDEEEEVKKEKTDSPLLNNNLTPFEHGQLFAKFCSSDGTITKEKFTEMLNALKISGPLPAVETKKEDAFTPRKQFDAGMLFSRYDPDSRGSIDQDAFRKIFREVVVDENSKAEEQHMPDKRPATNATAYDHQYRYMYSSPLPHLRTYSGEYDDTGSALLRRDYVHLRGLLEAILAPRIEQEVSSVGLVEEAKEKIKANVKKVTEETNSIANAAIGRLDTEADKRCKECTSLLENHERVLAEIQRFKQLAFGPRPRDALDMEHYTSSVLPLQPRLATGAKSVTEESQTFNYYRQHEKAQAAYKEQERHPHPVVMREFVSMFEEFKDAAQRIASAPAPLLGSKRQNKPTHIILEDIVNKPLAKELKDATEKSRDYEELQKQIELKDRIIYAMVQERENFEKEKALVLSQIKEISERSATEIKQWALLHEETTQEMSARIARLQEENRVLQLNK